MVSTDGLLLRIFVGESDRYDTRPLYEWIVTEARVQGLAGATVLRGLMGFGSNSRVIHTFKIERLSEDLPIIIEVVDSRDTIESFVTFLEQHVHTDFLATMEPLRIRLHRGDAAMGSEAGA